MIKVSEYMANVEKLGTDYTTLSKINKALETVLDEENKVLEAPGKIEAKLRGTADDLQLSPTTIKLVGFVPKIGTALKTAANIADTVGDEIDRQADIMGRLDAAWATPRKIVTGGEYLLKLNDAVLFPGTQTSGFRFEEAKALQASIEGDVLPDGSRLEARMVAFNADAEAWFDLRGSAIARLENAVEAAGKKVAEFAESLPDTGALDAASRAVGAVFDPIQSVIDKVEDVLHTRFVYVPEVRFLGKVIVKEQSATIAYLVEHIDGFISSIRNKIKAEVDKLLKKAGIEIGGILDDLKDRLLDPLDPIFDKIKAGFDKVQEIVDALKQVADEILQPLRDFVQYLENEFADTLFDNRVFGDQQFSTVNDTLTGGDEEDGMFGLKGDDMLDGKGGDDFLFGGVGNDGLKGGEGNDEVHGGAGADMIFGQAGDDLIFAGSGDDTVETGDGRNTVVAGDGDDTITGGDGNDDIDAGDGNDTVAAGGGADNVDGGAGRDRIDLGSGDDTGKGGAGRDRVDGGDGNDTISGGAGKDVLRGGDGNDGVSGDGGRDTVKGEDGIDELSGGGGRDKVIGGDGADVIDGGAGRDVLRGGEDEDVFSFTGGDGRDRIADYEDGLDQIELRGIVDYQIVSRGGDAVVRYDGGVVRVDGAAGQIDESDFVIRDVIFESSGDFIV